MQPARGALAAFLVQNVLPAEPSNTIAGKKIELVKGKVVELKYTGRYYTMPLFLASISNVIHETNQRLTIVKSQPDDRIRITDTFGLEFLKHAHKVVFEFEVLFRTNSWM